MQTQCMSLYEFIIKSLVSEQSDNIVDASLKTEAK